MKKRILLSVMCVLLLPFSARGANEMSNPGAEEGGPDVGWSHENWRRDGDVWYPPGNTGRTGDHYFSRQSHVPSGTMRLYQSFTGYQGEFFDVEAYVILGAQPGITVTVELVWYDENLSGTRSVLDSRSRSTSGQDNSWVQLAGSFAVQGSWASGIRDAVISLEVSASGADGLWAAHVDDVLAEARPSLYPGPGEVILESFDDSSWQEDLADSGLDDQPDLCTGGSWPALREWFVRATDGTYQSNGPCQGFSTARGATQGGVLEQRWLVLSRQYDLQSHESGTISAWTMVEPGGSAYLFRIAYRLGEHGAADLANNPGLWTDIARYEEGEAGGGVPDDTGSLWDQSTTSIADTGTNTRITIGLLLQVETGGSKNSCEGVIYCDYVTWAADFVDVVNWELY